MKNHQDRQDRQEEYIHYLYDVIDILKQKLCNAELQYKEYSGKLRQSEKESDLKEKFILFRESQLSELEDEIYKLKERIKFLTSKMSALYLPPILMGLGESQIPYAHIPISIPLHPHL